MFLLGLADLYIKYDVTRELAYGFSFDTKSLLEMAQNLIDFVLNLLGGIGGILGGLLGGIFG
jgi:hypothetical protein